MSPGRRELVLVRPLPWGAGHPPPHRRPLPTTARAADPLHPHPAGAAHQHAVPARIGLLGVVDDAPTHVPRASEPPVQTNAHSPLAAPAATPPSPADAAHRADPPAQAAGPTPTAPDATPSLLRSTAAAPQHPPASRHRGSPRPPTPRHHQLGGTPPREPRDPARRAA